MSLSKVRIIMQDLDERTEYLYVYYGIYCPEKDEVLIPFTSRASLERAIKKAGGGEKDALEKIYVNGGVRYYDCNQDEDA